MDYTTVELRTKHELRTLFEEVDLDNSGYISYRELRDFLVINNHTLPKHVLKKIYNNADTNGDGRLDYMEFVVLVTHPDNRDFFRDLFTTCLNKYISFILPPQSPRYKRSQSATSEGKPRYIDLMKCCPPPICMILISILDVVFFAIDAANGDVNGTGTTANGLIYDPYRRHEAWRYITYMFVHVGYIHLIMNLVIQIMLGIILEVFNRWWRVLLIYLAGVLAGSLGTFVVHPTNQLAGASGGVYSLITAHVATIILNYSEMRFPLTNLMVFFAFTIGDLTHVFLSDDPNIGHVTHFCGALAGLLVGVFILTNISEHRTEKIVQLIALIIYIFLMGGAVVWNIAR